MLLCGLSKETLLNINKEQGLTDTRGRHSITFYDWIDLQTPTSFKIIKYNDDRWRSLQSPQWSNGEKCFVVYLIKMDVHISYLVGLLLRFFPHLFVLRFEMKQTLLICRYSTNRTKVSTKPNEFSFLWFRTKLFSFCSLFIICFAARFTIYDSDNFNLWYYSKITHTLCQHQQLLLQ